MFLVPGLKAPRSADTSMESSGWGVPGCPHSQPTRGLGSVVSSHMKWGIFKILWHLGLEWTHMTDTEIGILVLFGSIIHRQHDSA